MMRTTRVFLSGAARELRYSPVTPSFQGSALLRPNRRVNLSPDTWLLKEGSGQSSQEVEKYPSHVTSTLQLMHLGHKLKQVQDPPPKQMVGGGA